MFKGISLKSELHLRFHFKLDVNQTKAQNLICQNFHGRRVFVETSKYKTSKIGESFYVEFLWILDRKSNICLVFFSLDIETTINIELFQISPITNVS